MMRLAIITVTGLFFVLGMATAVADDDDDDSDEIDELVLVLDSDVEFRPLREGCNLVIGVAAREANDDDHYDVEFCSRSSISLPIGCEATTCMDVDEFQIVVVDEDSSMTAEVIDVAGVPSFATRVAIDQAISELADSNPLAAAGWEGRIIFTWATMLGTVADASGDLDDFDGGEAQYEGGLEFSGVVRARGTLRFVAVDDD